MSRGIITPHPRKAIIEADEQTYGNLFWWCDLERTFRQFRTLVSGTGTAYDEALDKMLRAIVDAKELKRLISKARREYRALEKRLAQRLPITRPTQRRKP